MSDLENNPPEEIEEQRDTVDLVRGAVTSLLESNGNSIILNFPFATTRNGLTGTNIQVELRSLDLGFDISTATVRATFA